ncbi:MAG: FHA domain-containing protein [Lentisphaeria bacterium]|nr:FHA domain-containing protein [Lentisphaeria bacterium]
MLRITIRFRDRQRLESVPEDSVVLGRRGSGVSMIDVDLAPDLAVSRRHARLVCDRRDLWIEDLGSTHGTTVSGFPVTQGKRHKVNPRDRIVIGETVLFAALDPDWEGPPTAVEDGMTATRVRNAEVPPGSEELARALGVPDEHRVSLLHLPIRLAGATTLEDVVDLAIPAIEGLFPEADQGALFLLDPVSGTPVPRASFPSCSVKFARDMVLRALQEKKATLWTTHDRFAAGRNGEGPILRCALVAPLPGYGTTVAALAVGNSRSPSALTPELLDVLVLAAHYIALALARVSKPQPERPA